MKFKEKWVGQVCPAADNSKTHRNGGECCDLRESNKAEQVERNGDNLVSMTQVRSSQCLGMGVETLRTFTKKLLPTFCLGYWENFGFALMVQDLMKRKKITWCRAGVEENLCSRLWE